MKLTQNTASIRIVLWVAIVVVLNLLAYRFFFRLDFTADERYTLSSSTREILENLEDPVTITAYFSENLPAEVASIKNDFRDMLYEYQSVSNGKVVFEFVNPNEDQQSEQAAQQQGISPLAINVRKRNKAEQIVAFLGAVIKIKNRQDVIPVVQPGSGMEYAISSRIKRLNTEDKPKVGFVRGHGEPDLRQLGAILQELSTQYELDTLLLAEPNAWTEFKTLVILAPADSFTQAELSELDMFLQSGGNLFAGINMAGIVPYAQQQALVPINTGLDAWLGEKGFEITQTVLTDVQSGKVPVNMGGYSALMDFPYFPIVSNYAEHPITDGLEGVGFIFASPVIANPEDSTLESGSLAYTSERTGQVSPPLIIDIRKEWTDSDFTAGAQSVAAYLKGNIVGDVESKMVVVGDGDFISDQGNSNNIFFLINAIDWLTDDTGLIALRTKSVENRFIEKQLSDTEKTVMKYLVFLFPILILLIFGMLRSQRRKQKRLSWMQEDYS